jgi:hypothetical protein
VVVSHKEAVGRHPLEFSNGSRKQVEQAKGRGAPADKVEELMFILPQATRRPLCP